MGVVSRWLSWDLSLVGQGCLNVIKAGWHLGITGFGGPPVHFRIFHTKYVDKLGWIDEQMYQEMFSLSQALSGPASTKMLYCINLIHDGFLPAVIGFFIWSLPGALGMFGLSLGVSRIGQDLPPVAYAILSGLNAAVVGIIALAAVELSRKAITDKLTRILVFFGGAAGMLYNALWYFPLLLVISGTATLVFDFRLLHRPVGAVARMATRYRGSSGETAENHRAENGMGAQLDGRPSDNGTMAAELSDVGHLANRTRGSSAEPPVTRSRAPRQAASSAPDSEPPREASHSETARIVPPERKLSLSWKVGVPVLCLFLLSFAAVMVLRGVLPGGHLLYRLFSNLYLAGTIIFGGGPVVIPLLREYIVAEGWVTPRDFLIGLAIIQAFPGPNFNFAVYLGAMTASNGGYHLAAGAVLGYLGIFLPGMVICHGTMGVWSTIRGWRAVRSLLRGFNAAAVGLIYTAVYRLWQIGYIDKGFLQGTSLATDPWWVVITATSYVGGASFQLSPPVAIVLGAVMGIIRYGVVST